MSRSLRRGGTAAIVLALAAVSLSACAAGTSSQTLQIQPDVPNASAGTDLKINGIVVVVGETQTSGEPGPANVTLNISNTGNAPETLQSLSIAGTSATFQDATGGALPGGIVVPPLGSVALGQQGQPSAHLAAASLKIGGFEPAAFSFSTAGKVATTALVTPATGTYESYAPASPSASASAAATASATAGGTASPAASGSPSAAASPSAGASASASASASAH
ncbi:DUF461 domain-containing protein [Kitasatospora sp. NPDC006697]|uniref:DUF461 domain-containing protein n=1 Tax=Kitasatospora sp. NPDC006697 TaxID=3364020 RepID=UPI00369598BD